MPTVRGVPAVQAVLKFCMLINSQGQDIKSHRTVLFKVSHDAYCSRAVA